MPTLDVTEYASMPSDQNGRSIPTGKEPSITNQQLTVGGTSAPSAAFGAETRFVRLHSDSTCRIAFGRSPVASGASMRLVAGATEFVGVNPGDQVACIAST